MITDFKYLDEDETIERNLTKEDVQLAESAKHWLDDKIQEFFSDYCSVFGIHPAYGVDDYRLDYKQIYIKQDTSCRGCYNSETHYLPAEWFYAADRIALMQASLDLKRKKEEEKKAIDKARQIEYLKAQLKELEV